MNSQILSLTIAALLTSGMASGQQFGGGGMGGGGMGGGGMGGGTTLTTFVTDDFSGSGNCAMCHGLLTDTTGADVSIDTHWRSTMMANSGKDPLWQAKLESEVTRNPALSGLIQEKCSRCHMGMANKQQHATLGGDVAVLGTGYLDPNHPLHEAALDGVSCALCHQIRADGLGTLDTYTGQHFIDTSTYAPDRPMFGKFADPFPNPMRMHVGFTPTPGSQVEGAALCGSCHTLYTPVVDPQGVPTGQEFPEQMTYLEWRHGALGGGVSANATCQDCHVPDAAGAAAISNRPMWLAARSPFGMHHFAGANTFMLGVLGSHIAELGLTAAAAQLGATQARTATLLQTATARVSIPSAQIASGVLTAVVKVENLAGHKVPSGVPLRRAWLHVRVVDGKGKLLFESGAPQTDGAIAGNDADFDPAAFEPHYDLIGNPGEVQIYESIMHDLDGALTFTFLQASGYLKDNRLLPSGFNKSTAPDDIAVRGGAATDSNFTGGADAVTYRVVLPRYSGRITVTARLLYQSVSFGGVRDLRADPTPLVSRFTGYYDAASKTPAVVATVQKRL